MPTAVMEKKENQKAVAKLSTYKPPLSLYENGDSFIVFIELPGVDEKSLKITLNDGVLTVDAPLSLDLPQEAKLIHAETRLGNYRRSIELTDRVDEQKIDATFKAGLLKLVLPKSKGARTHNISIKTA